MEDRPTMSERYPLSQYDYRIVHYLIRNGILSQKDYDDFLKSLPDSESNAEYMEVYEEPSFFEENRQDAGLAFV
jgi:hypothetical protein